MLAGTGLTGASSGEVTCGEQTPGLLCWLSLPSWTLERSKIAEDSRSDFSASQSGFLAMLRKYIYLF